MPGHTDAMKSRCSKETASPTLFESAEALPEKAQHESGALVESLVSRSPEVDALLDAQAPLIICVSGGKDSRLAAELSVAYARGRGHTGRVVLIYSNLNTQAFTVTWFDALSQCQQLAARLDVELIVVAREKGGLMERLQSRWQANLKRYIALECVTLILPWATPKMRFCTSELKVQLIQRWVRKTFGSQPVVCVIGIRRDEGTSEKKGRGTAQVVKVYRRKNGKKPPMPEGSVDWNIIVEVKTPVVFQIHRRSGIPLAEAYEKFGASRFSCSLCFMASRGDLLAALRDPRNHHIYRAKCALEILSAFSYQGENWLSDLDPKLLSEAQRTGLKRAKWIALERERIEARIPPHLLFKNDGGLHGWPQTMPTDDEAELIAGARREVAALYDLEVGYTSGPAVRARYGELIAKKAVRDARRGGTPSASVPEKSEATYAQKLLFAA